MSLALATKGIISGFGGGGGGRIAVPVCKPEVESTEYAKLRLLSEDVEELRPDIHGKNLKPSIKISIPD